MSGGRHLLALATLLAIPSGLAADEERFGERISVMAVEIPVRVLLEGRPVAGLKAADFRVLEDGEEHEIVGFEEIDLTEIQLRPALEETLPTVPAARSGDGRRLLLLFDVAFSGRRPLVRAVEGVRELVDTGLHASDRAAVATYSATAGLRFLTGFTSDRDETRLALDVVGAGVVGDRRAHGAAVLALTERGGLAGAGTPIERFRFLSEEFGRAAAVAFEEAEADLGVASVGVSSVGVGAALVPSVSRFNSSVSALDPVRGSFQNIAPGQIASGLAAGVGRSGVRSLSLELAELATVLRDLPGQKHLYFLSQGFNSEMLDDATSLHHLQKALEALRRASWAIQAIDIEGTGFGADSLFYLANETGGELVENHLDVGRAATKLVERTARYYVLTIQPTDVPADDRYRKLEVKLVHGPRRAKVYHRPGYYTPKPRSQRNSLENTLDAAALLLSQREAHDLAAEVLAVPLPGLGFADVPVVVDLPGGELAPVRSALVVEFHGYALDPSGEIQDLFSQRVRLGRQKARELIEEGVGLRFYDRVTLPPGDYTLRVLVRVLTTGKSFLRSLPLAVPAALDRPSVDGPLFVVDDGWTVLRGDGSLNSGRGVEHPFVLAGKAWIPSPRPSLRPGGSAFFFLKTRKLDADDLKIGARVLDSSGRPVDGAGLAFRERVLGTADRVEALIGTLAAGELGPGSYRLEIAATWAGGTRRTVGQGEFVVAE